MRKIRIHAGFRVAAGIAALALPLAVAGNAFAAPGDNGDVKIHDITTDTDVEANNPHVCDFYLDAFNFDGLQKVHWEIDTWAGSDTDDTKGSLAAQGDITLKLDGSGQTVPVTLPDDHYKLFWTFVGENGKAKHKAFWVDCKGADLIGGVDVNIGGSSSSSSPGKGGSSGGATGGTGGSTGGSGGTGGSTGGPASSPTSTTPKSPASTSAPAPGSSTSPSTESTGKLAHTGADGSALIYAVVSAAVLAGGGYGLRRYATTRSKA